MYPVAPVVPVMPETRHKPASAGTAETLILVAFIFQILSTVGVLALVFLLGSFGLFVLFGGFLIALALVIGVISVFMLYVAYAWSLERARRGDYEGAKGPTLLLGILGLIFGGLIVGILYIIAYVKLGEAATECRAPMWGPSAPFAPWGSAPAYPAGVLYAYPTAPAGAAPLPSSAIPAGAPGAMGSSPPYCSRCGKPTTYIAQYARFYCYPCAVYA